MYYISSDKTHIKFIKQELNTLVYQVFISLCYNYLLQFEETHELHDT